MARAPIDYTLNVINPLQAAMEGYSFGLREVQAEKDEARNVERFGMEKEKFAMAQRAEADRRAAAARSAAAAQRSAARKQSFYNDFSRVVNGEISRKELLANYPDFASTMKSTFDLIPNDVADARVATGKRIQNALNSGRTDIAEQLLDEQIAAAQNTPGQENLARQLEVMKDQMGESPRMVFEEIGLQIEGFGDEGLEWRGVNADGPLQVRSSKILEDGTVVTVTDAGPQVFSPTGEEVTGQAAADAVRAAQEFGVEIQTERAGGREAGTLGARAELGAEAAGASEAGKTAIQIGNKTFERIGPLRSNIGRLDRAIELVEEEGANTGVIASRLPNWKSSTVELNNLRSELGLDVVGAVTFGALNKGELDLALTVALPTNLSEGKLVDWLERKRDAQDKLADYLTQQARFLTTPGRTLNQWIDFTESGEKDVRKWMRENPVGRRTERVPSDAPTATPETASDNAQFVEDMQAKANRGEPFTQAEINRLKIISQGGQ